MDETQPLLRERIIDGDEDGPHKVAVSVGKDIVDFDPNGDVDNPRDWPKAYKWGIVGLLAFMAFTV